MSDAGFERCMDVVWLPRNDGQALHETAGDAGGWTAWGITLAAFTAWRLGRRLPAPGAAELGAVLLAERYDFYYAGYWMPAAGDRLQVGVDLMMLEIAIMSGPGTAAMLMREVVGMPHGYRMDAETIARAQAAGAPDLVMRLAHAHNTYDVALRGDGQFQGGWYDRVQADQVIALGWLARGVPAQLLAASPELAGAGIGG